MFYEVQIPIGRGLTTRTMQIQADSWRDAYTTGIVQTDGVAPGDLSGAFVDVGRELIAITDARTRRVIRVTPIDPARVRQSQMLRVVSEPPVPREPSREPSSSKSSVGFTDRNTGTFRTIGSTEIQKPTADSGRTGRVVADTAMPTGPLRSDSVVAEVPDALTAEDVSVSETALEDVFLEITALFEPGFAMEDAIDFVLDLACKYVPSGTGGLLFAADSGDHLYFASARGQKRKTFLKAEVSTRDGLPAASLKDGVAIAIADPGADPRHTDELALAGGIDVNNICAAPIQSGERAYGVLLMMNREERSFYSQYDANILTYIGSQMGKFIQDQLDAAPLE